MSALRSGPGTPSFHEKRNVVLPTPSTSPRRGGACSTGRRSTTSCSQEPAQDDGSRGSSACSCVCGAGRAGWSTLSWLVRDGRPSIHRADGKWRVTQASVLLRTRLRGSLHCALALIPHPCLFPWVRRPPAPLLTPRGHTDPARGCQDPGGVLSGPHGEGVYVAPAEALGRLDPVGALCPAGPAKLGLYCF